MYIQKASKVDYGVTSNLKRVFIIFIIILKLASILISLTVHQAENGEKVHDKAKLLELSSWRLGVIEKLIDYVFRPKTRTSL